MTTMTLLDFKEKMNLSDIPDSWNEIYEDTVNQLKKSGLECIEEDYILRLNNEYHLFDEYFDVVLEAVEKLRQNKNLKRGKTCCFP